MAIGIICRKTGARTAVIRVVMEDQLIIVW